MSPKAKPDPKPELTVLPPPERDRTREWRYAHAAAWEVDVIQIEGCLDEMDVTQELLVESGRDRAAAALRHAGGFLREVRDDLNDDIRKLRAASK